MSQQLLKLPGDSSRVTWRCLPSASGRARASGRLSWSTSRPPWREGSPSQLKTRNMLKQKSKKGLHIFRMDFALTSVIFVETCSPSHHSSCLPTSPHHPKLQGTKAGQAKSAMISTEMQTFITDSKSSRKAAGSPSRGAVERDRMVWVVAGWDEQCVKNCPFKRMVEICWNMLKLRCETDEHVLLVPRIFVGKKTMRTLGSYLADWI